jgi:hypothetical protein
MIKSANFSECRQYRYALWRGWDDACSVDYAMFIGLNPSTADETEDDPTIRRCIQFAKDWGYAGLCMTNLFAFRATDPKVMKQVVDPVGIDNDQWLSECGLRARVIVAAWGTHGVHRSRDATVRRLIPNLSYLKLTKDGLPSHPLYLPKTLTPVAWE